MAEFFWLLVHNRCGRSMDQTSYQTPETQRWRSNPAFSCRAPLTISAGGPRFCGTTEGGCPSTALKAGSSHSLRKDGPRYPQPEPETPTSPASACQCLGCGLRRPARMRPAYQRETEISFEMALHEI